MDLVADEELFAIETISSHTQFLMNKSLERFIHPMVPVAAERHNEDVAMDAAAAARQLGIHVRAAQRWVKHYYKDPENIFEKKKKSGRRRTLGEEHKKFLLNYIDDNPSGVVTEVVENLKQNFVDLSVSRSTVYNFMTTQRNLSLKQAQFQPVERSSEEKKSVTVRLGPKWQQTDPESTILRGRHFQDGALPFFLPD
ncbi:Homeodomain-like DNA binding domain-containing transcription factor [Phycomyces blakesleeanus NRRL 1555(-)]|uniref:Homeodomain-like DNA binding domain-containing transcription factor n=1 Tax=Phycomyces blakesleeanus (strain ATCC 8743b / DSM 1359 / FGSC 10004 / NBRC 33097 / NRRL 1555) TaxID=763407 RepID=A0A162N906_PHYB8|nr:Homeodomain-like DNA binding domain-containing transcription factor [Phycomyces blakesleeanus NRRL 1555(-)]OAD72228.1 Homeodomain-like DNA binding domain-containing transcription factor [Phycomyces blakesleeanus NRRL 1555(-)]|eukprot:XP_018290268.1 Homeodomain-like DNA binding domain-containing transcription factor [Phycomyces blakesleeanus NRRL 1555(-)]